MPITFFEAHITFIFFLRDNVRVGGNLQKAVILTKKKKGLRISVRLGYTYIYVN